jgi:hypothetical protein
MLRRLWPTIISLTVAITLGFGPGCVREENPISPPSPRFHQKVSGQLAIGTPQGLRVSNSCGSVTLEGEARDSTASWSLETWVSASSADEAETKFREILLDTVVTADSVLIRVVAGNDPSLTADLCLRLPQEIPCELSEVRDRTHTANLQSTLLGQRLGTATVRGHVGSCVLAAGTGTIDVEMVLPDSGLCSLVLGKGNIRLQIPVATSAFLSAVTGAGTVNVVGLTLRQSAVTPGSVTGVLGEGSARVVLATGSGNVGVVGMN